MAAFHKTRWNVALFPNFVGFKLDHTMIRSLVISTAPLYSLLLFVAVFNYLCRYGQRVDLVRFVLFRRGPGLTRVFQTKYNGNGGGGGGGDGYSNSGGVVSSSGGLSGLLRHQLLPLLQLGFTAVGIGQALVNSRASSPGGRGGGGNGGLWRSSEPFAEMIALMSSLLFGSTSYGSDDLPTSVVAISGYDSAVAPTSATAASASAALPVSGSDFERVLAGFVLQQSTEQQPNNPAGSGTASLPAASFPTQNLPSFSMP